MSFKAGQHLILGPFSISPYYWARKTIPHKAVLSVLAVHRNDLENFKKNRSLNPIPRDSNLVWGIMIFKAPQVNLMGSHLQSTPMLTKVVSLNYAIYSIHKYLLGRHIGGMGKIYSVSNGLQGRGESPTFSENVTARIVQHLKKNAPNQCPSSFWGEVLPSLFNPWERRLGKIKWLEWGLVKNGDLKESRIVEPEEISEVT